MTLHCKTCQYEWEFPLMFPMVLSTFTDLTKKAAKDGCPKCGGEVMLGPHIQICVCGHALRAHNNVGCDCGNCTGFTVHLPEASPKKFPRMQIVTLITANPKRARRGHPAIGAGTKLHCIQYPDGSFFVYGYLSRSAAETVMNNLTGSQEEIHFNSTRDVDRILQSWTSVKP